MYIKRLQICDKCIFNTSQIVKSGYIAVTNLWRIKSLDLSFPGGMSMLHLHARLRNGKGAISLMIWLAASQYMPGPYAVSAFGKAVPGTQRHSLAAFQCSLLPDLDLYNPNSRTSFTMLPKMQTLKRRRGGGDLPVWQALNKRKPSLLHNSVNALKGLGESISFW